MAWWRPPKITPAVLSKLEEGFTYSLTDEECCLFADISPKTLYRYIEDNPKFWQRKEILKRQPNITAKMNWTNEIKKWTYNSSKEWLERKAKSEFSLRQEIQAEVEWNIIIKFDI
jgi:hypothetical protein